LNIAGGKDSGETESERFFAARPMAGYSEGSRLQLTLDARKASMILVRGEEVSRGVMEAIAAAKRTVFLWRCFSVISGHNPVH